jgi:hypothetical protein
MRVARVWDGERELAAVEYEGGFYRVDRLDAALGVPLPDDMMGVAGDFSTRVFGLSMLGLADHLDALVTGSRLDDALCDPYAARVLPPCGRSPQVLELVSPGASALSARLSSRALYGHDTSVVLPLDEPHARVAPAVAFVVGDDLQRASVDEARRAIAGRCLALAWSIERESLEATSEGMGPWPGREVGTHLGPFLRASTGVGLSTPIEPLPSSLDVELQVGPPRPSMWFDEASIVDVDVDVAGSRLSTALEAPIDRIATALALASRFAPVIAGDVLVVSSRAHLVVPRGWEATLRADGLGELVGRAGFDGV